MKKAGLTVLILSVILLSGCVKTQKNQNHDGNGREVSGQEEAPLTVVFEGHDMEGNVVSSDVFSDSKLTMVNVWATYCNPCLREMPELGELAGEYDREDFQIIGIISDVQEGASQKSVDYAADLIETTGADYTHLFLNESLYFGLLEDVTAVPTTFFIDENGEILDIVVGAMKKTEWEEKIDALLEEQ